MSRGSLLCRRGRTRLSFFSDRRHGCYPTPKGNFGVSDYVYRPRAGAGNARSRRCSSRPRLSSGPCGDPTGPAGGASVATRCSVRSAGYEGRTEPERSAGTAGRAGREARRTIRRPRRDPREAPVRARPGAAGSRPPAPRESLVEARRPTGLASLAEAGPPKPTHRPVRPRSPRYGPPPSSPAPPAPGRSRKALRVPRRRLLPASSPRLRSRPRTHRSPGPGNPSRVGTDPRRSRDAPLRPRRLLPVGAPLPQLRRRPPADRHRRAGASSGRDPVRPRTRCALPLRGGRLPARSTTRNAGLRRRPDWVREDGPVRGLRIRSGGP